MKLKTITLVNLGKKNLKQQIKKIQEEYKEMLNANFEYYRSCESEKERLHLISELYDIIQAAAGALWIVEGGVSMNNEHIEKIEGYEATGRINNKAREE